MGTENKVQPGDTVKLRSGGPTMTVRSYDTSMLRESDTDVICEWFDKQNVLSRAAFKQESLEKVTVEKSVWVL